MQKYKQKHRALRSYFCILTSHFLLLTSAFALLPSLDFLQALDLMNSRDFAQAGDDGLQVLQVGDVEDDFHAGLAVGGMSGDVADVAFGVADHASDALQ